MTTQDAPLTAGDAALVPLVAVALLVVDALDVGLGDACVVTGSTDTARVAAVVATWAGALPVTLAARGPAPVGLPSSVRFVSVDDLEATIAALTAGLADRPGVVAAELSGIAELADVLLQSVPMFARVLFAGSAREKLTVDFYTNVHRKGLVLRSAVLDPAALAGPAWPAAGEDPRERAARLLAHPGRAAECRAALGRPTP